MKALISPLEQRVDGYRVAEVHPVGFEVAHPFFWVECSDEVERDTHWYDPASETLHLMPADVAEPTAPPAPTGTTPLQFIDRFTEAEQLAIVTATMSVPQVKLWYDKLLAAQEVVFADPRLSSGLDGLVAAGLITAERKAEILPEAQTSGVTVL